MTQISLVELHKHLLIAISPVLVQTVNLSGKEKVGPKSDSDLLFQIPLVGFYFNLHFLSLYVTKIHKTNTFHSWEEISSVFFLALLVVFDFCSQSAFLESHRYIYR